MSLTGLEKVIDELGTEMGDSMKGVARGMRKGLYDPGFYKPAAAASIGVPALYNFLYGYSLIKCLAMAGVTGLLLFGIYGIVDHYKKCRKKSAK
jgi:hypothetical protein